MFDAVRNNKKIVQVFLALITLPFAMWGVDSYVRNAGAGNDPASVGGSKITQQEFMQAIQGEKDRMKQALGTSFKPEMIDTPEFRATVINSLIDRRLLQLEAQKSRLGVGDALLVQVISSAPALQENGKFSPARYRQMAAERGMSTEMFEASLRSDLILQQLVGAIGDTGIVSATSADMMLRIQGEERQVAELRIVPEQMLGEVKLEPDAAKKFYDENQKLFMTPEQVKAEYVVLSLESLLPQIAVSEAEVKAWYEGHKDVYQQAEQRRASHILISTGGSSDEEKAKAKAKADEILAEVKKNPAKFAELAKKHSQDPGSGANGGDLGFFGRGMMVKPFEDTVFSQKEGEISGLVQSEFGYHIIKLTGIKPAKIRSLDEVRAEIEGELKRQGASRKFAEAASEFGNMVYEQSDSLKPVIERFKLAPKQTAFIPKNLPPQALQALGPIGNEKLIVALFSDDAVKNKRNTDAVDVAPNTLVAARVLEHKPATLKPFESVRADIEADLKAREAAVLAKKKGEARLAELQGGTDKINWVLVKYVSRLQGKQVPPAAMQAIFRADVQKLPAYAGVELPNNAGYALYKIMAVKPLEGVEENKRRVLQREYTNIVSQEDFTAYLAGLRKRYKIEINKAVVEAKDKPL